MLLLLVGLIVLVCYLPLLAAMLFVAFLTMAAMIKTKIDGSWSGVRLFLKEILLGW